MIASYLKACKGGKKMKKIPVLVVLSILLIPLAAGAFDYKNWFSLLPRALSGMVPSGEPQGMNMDMGGQKWSSLNQEYTSRDGKKTAQLSIVAGQVAPQVQGFQSMAAMNMNMETEDQIIKIVTVSGKKSMLTLDKKSKTGTLIIPVKEAMVVALTLEPAKSVNDLTSLAKEIPFSRFASAP
jgi:hypothetical protein